MTWWNNTNVWTSYWKVILMLILGLIMKVTSRLTTRFCYWLKRTMNFFLFLSRSCSWKILGMKIDGLQPGYWLITYSLFTSKNRNKEMWCRVRPISLNNKPDVITKAISFTGFFLLQLISFIYSIEHDEHLSTIST